ncbi:hypothetical protein FA95DRAFT_1201458 [Auriscalpium vulgare]|nr:hypothetical protein FA95DRAFT_1201458 [Auriscalpium vulgare]
MTLSMRVFPGLFFPSLSFVFQPFCVMKMGSYVDRASMTMSSASMTRNVAYPAQTQATAYPMNRPIVRVFVYSVERGVGTSQIVVVLLSVLSAVAFNGHDSVHSTRTYARNQARHARRDAPPMIQAV